MTSEPEQRPQIVILADARRAACQARLAAAIPILEDQAELYWSSSGNLYGHRIGGDGE